MRRRGRRPLGRLHPWRWYLAGAAAIAFAALVAVNAWLGSQPAKPDVAAVHADIAAGRSGVEVTFDGRVLADPAKVGDHEQIQVDDGAGDQLELDYNLGLGQWIPAHSGDRLLVHGQLYIDSGRYGVHCLHARTSSGCPLPGFVELAGQTYN